MASAASWRSAGRACARVFIVMRVSRVPGRFRDDLVRDASLASGNVAHPCLEVTVFCGAGLAGVRQVPTGACAASLLDALREGAAPAIGQLDGTELPG